MTEIYERINDRNEQNSRYQRQDAHDDIVRLEFVYVYEYDVNFRWQVTVGVRLGLCHERNANANWKLLGLGAKNTERSFLKWNEYTLC